MKFKYILKDLIPFYNKPKSEIKRNLFFSLFITVNITLTILFLVIPVFQNFFTVYFAVFNTLFVGVGVTSSQSFYELIKNQIRILFAVFCGLIIAYISHAISLHRIWTSIFVTTIFVYISSSLMMTSKFLPYNLGKLMYIPYFNLVFFNDPLNYSPIPFLKFLLTGVTPLILILTTGIIFNVDFSSTYYIQTCQQILKTSRKFISTIESEFEIKTIESLDIPSLNLDSYKNKLIKNIKSNKVQVKEVKKQMEKEENKIDDIISTVISSSSSSSSSDHEDDNNDDNNNNNNLKINSPNSILKKKVCFKNPTSSPLNKVIDKISKSEYNSPIQSVNSEYGDSSTNQTSKKSTTPPITTPNTINFNLFKNFSSKKKSTPTNHNNNNNNKANDYFKIEIEKLNIESSRNLNNMERYLVEVKKEFWNKDLIPYFNELSYLLETNHKKLLTINTAVLENIGSTERSKSLLEILPHLNTLIITIVKIFKIMEKQISKKYKPADSTPQLVNDDNFNTENLFESIDMNNFVEMVDFKKGQQFLKSTESIQKFGALRKYKTLEYSQYKILLYFDCVDQTIKDINNVLSDIYNPETSFSIDNIDEETRLNFLLSAFKKFSKDQKVLASTVFILSHKLWKITSGRRQHITMITSSFTRFCNFIKSHYHVVTNHKEHHHFQHDPMAEPWKIKFSNHDKILIWWRVISKRLTVKWKYCLSFSLGLTVFPIVYYELKVHGNFILFRNLAWAVITYCLVSTPSVGALAFFSMLRVIGAVLGSILGYVCAVIYSTTSNDTARAFIFTSLTFCVSFVGCIFTRGKSFDKLLLFFILSFVVIAFLAYPGDGGPSIITSLLRMMHILFAVLLVLVISILFTPYYEHKQLKSNLYTLPFKITQTFNFLICNTLIDPKILPQESKKLYYSSSKSNYIQTHLPSEMNQKSIKELLSKQLNLLRYQIPIQRTLLFNSRYELFPFKKRKYYQLRRLLYTETKLFHSLLSLEFITISALPKKHLNHVATIISKNLLKLMSELDYCSNSFMSNIESKEYEERFVQENSSKQICNEIARDIGEYIFKNRYDKESLNLLRYCSAIIFCLISFIDLFNLVFDQVVILSKTIVLKRIDNNYLPVNKRISKDNQDEEINNNINTPIQGESEDVINNIIEKYPNNLENIIIDKFLNDDEEQLEREEEDQYDNSKIPLPRLDRDFDTKDENNLDFDNIVKNIDEFHSPSNKIGDSNQ